MKILHINHQYRPYGGGERYLLDLCSILEKNGHSNVVVSSIHSENYHFESRKEFFIERSFGLRSGLKMKGLIEDIVSREKPDLIHLHETLFFLSPLIIQWLINHKPTVQTLHTSFFFARGARRYYRMANSAITAWGECAQLRVACV